MHARWVETDPRSPGKAFAQEIVTTLRASMLNASANGNGWGAWPKKVWYGLRRRNGEGNLNGS
jgi:hypothetical protein